MKRRQRFPSLRPLSSLGVTMSRSIAVLAAAALAVAASPAVADKRVRSSKTSAARPKGAKTVRCDQRLMRR